MLETLKDHNKYVSYLEHIVEIKLNSGEVTSGYIVDVNYEIDNDVADGYDLYTPRKHLTETMPETKFFCDLIYLKDIEEINIIE